MSEITRKNLARGTKLVRQAVYTPLSDAATELSGPGIDADNLNQPWATFRVNLHIPWLDAKYFSNKDSGTLRFTIPFTLPPFQELFDDTNFLPDDGDTEIVLDEFQMSFDQRSEASAIASRNQTAAVNAGKLFPSAIDRLDLSVALLEKQQYIVDNNLPYWPEQEIFSSDLPAELFSSRTLRFNPVIVDELNKVMKPYRTYILVLDATDMWSTNEKVMLPALQFSLKLRAKITARDSGATDVQNLPTTHNGSTTGPTVTITSANADALISADDATRGVQSNMRAIDDQMAGKLRGGYSRDSDLDPTQQMSSDAAYEIICVPMFSGFGDEGVISAQHAADLPDRTSGAPYTDVQQDEVSIPIPWPMTIHHVTLAVNYQSPFSGAGDTVGGLHPTSGTYTNDVTVAIGTGRRSDEYTFQDVATVNWTTGNRANITIDRILGVRNSRATAETPGGATHYDWELLHCPLVVGPLGNGTGYYPQGKPFYVGLGSSKMWSRTSVGNGNVGVPYTRGAEQFIHCIWSFYDSGGLSDTGAVPAGAAGDPSEVYVGYMGHWIQIVGKKHLATIENEIPM